MSDVALSMRRMSLTSVQLLSERVAPRPQRETETQKERQIMRSKKKKRRRKKHGDGCSLEETESVEEDKN